MTATNINICVGGELEARAQSVLANFGLDVPTAFNMFLTQVVDRGTLSFEIDEPLELQPEKPTKLPFGRGCMKGKMWMADDFDAPLEDFREYME